MKKNVFIFLTVSLFLILAFQLDFQKNTQRGCPFCDPKTLEIQEFYRGEGVLGVLTYKPVVPGHVLIIPERHVERFEDLTSEEIRALGEAIQRVHGVVSKRYGTKDYLLLQKNGRHAGQSVPHVHFHYLPAERFLTFRFFITPWLKPHKPEELKPLRDALAESF